MELIPIREASKLSGICPQTLRTLSDSNEIKSYRTKSGQRKFDKQSLLLYFNIISDEEQAKEKTKERHNYIYTRVSSRKQKDDLDRQLEYIRSKDPKYSSYISLQDIGSGINFKRKGLETILDSCIRRDIGEVVIAHKDRLSRFGFELIKLFIEKAGGNIFVLKEDNHRSSEQELSEDLLSIVHIYSCRQMGKRRYAGNKIIQDKIETESETTEDF